MWTFKYTASNKEDIDWNTLLHIYPWLRILADCPQDPVFHAEGDVLTHTKMVVEELINLPTWKENTEEVQSMLFLAALMHDLAKPMCTVTENGQIRSPGHAKKGAQIARGMLYRGIPEAIPFPQREEIIQLIRHHGLPIWFWDKRDPQKMVIQASLHLNLQNVATLAKADMLGRVCNDQKEMLGRIDYFKEFAEENYSLNGPHPFENGLARYAYFNKKGSSPNYVPFDDTICEVTVMCGLPGAGKDTWVSQNRANWPIVSLDNIRRTHKISPKKNQGIVIQMAKEEAKSYLRKKQNFVWNATNLSRSLRSALFDLLTSYKAKVRLVYVETDYKTLLIRNKKREHPIPPKVLERFIDRLEMPQLWEAHEVEYHV